MGDKISRMSYEEIEDSLANGGFYIDPNHLDYVITVIRRLGRRGALIWSPDCITSEPSCGTLTVFSDK